MDWGENCDNAAALSPTAVLLLLHDLFKITIINQTYQKIVGINDWYYCNVLVKRSWEFDLWFRRRNNQEKVQVVCNLHCLVGEDSRG